MPRSNKKKKLVHHPVIPTSDEVVTQLLGREVTSMISKSIVSISYYVYIELNSMFTGKCKKTWHQTETWHS